MIDQEQLFQEIALGNFHKGGLRCLRLFSVNNDFSDRLRDELKRLVEERIPSDVGDPSHRTHWTKPYGKAVQYSLLNRSGDFNDTASDHDGSVLGKRFHYADEYPTVAEFISAFPHAINMRLNGLEPESGLSPHEEHVLWRSGKDYTFRTRFHLPVVTNDKAEMLLDGDLVHFEEGAIYYFNNGCVHSATNFGQTVRYHLVWDMRLTQDTFSLMFTELDENTPHFLTRFTEEERVVVPHAAEEIEEYQISGFAEAVYRHARLSRLGIKPHRLQNAYNRWDYLRYKRLGRPQFADIR